MLGDAEATTPLLDEPLKGKVYLRSSSHKLPDLVLDLEGQIDIELAGSIDTVEGRLRTTFEAVPDAPVTSVSSTSPVATKACCRTARASVARPRRPRSG